MKEYLLLAIRTLVQFILGWAVLIILIILYCILILFVRWLAHLVP